MGKHGKSRVSAGNIGGVFNGGNFPGLTINQGPPEPSPQPFDTARIRWLPLTERVLGLVSALLAVFVFLTGWQSFGAVHQALREFGAAQTGPVWLSPNVVWPLALVVVTSLLMTAWTWRGWIRGRSLHLSRFPQLPGLAGLTDSEGRGRLALVSLTGTCTALEGRCGGELRFVSKPVEWHDEIVNGRRHRVVDRSVPAAVCRRNPDHWYEIDPADTLD